MKKADLKSRVISNWKDRLPSDISVAEFERMIDDALSHNLGLTWIPYLCGDDTPRGQRMEFTAK